MYTEAIGAAEWNEGSLGMGLQTTRFAHLQVWVQYNYLVSFPDQKVTASYRLFRTSIVYSGMSSCIQHCDITIAMSLLGGSLTTSDSLGLSGL